MSGLIGPALLAALVAAVTTAAVVPLVGRVALAFRAVDYPGERRTHRGAVPRLGGLAVAFGVALGGGAVTLVQWNTWGQRVARSELVAFVIAAAIVFLIGLADDLVGQTVAMKFAAEIVAAVIIVMIGWSFTEVSLPGEGALQLGLLGKVLTVVWIVGVTNAVNLLDGLDGLAGGVVAIIAASLVVYSVLQQNLFTVILMAAIAGACVGFLRHNWRGEIFLGDAGALSLGFVLAVMTVHSSIKANAAIAMLVPVLALGVPVIDTLLVMAARFVETGATGVPDRFLRMFRADRNHLHHLLESWAGRRAHVVRVIYALVAAFCLAALAIAISRNAVAGLTLVGVELLVVLVVRRVGFAARMREIAARQRREAGELIGVKVPSGESGEVAAIAGSNEASGSVGPEGTVAP